MVAQKVAKTTKPASNCNNSVIVYPFMLYCISHWSILACYH
ncbi:hypothetical protein ENHYDAX1_130186 [Enhydrobacter sp. AX1]|nr:hypothetical protein ENHYDAX1_130186 [Enhydrobacter sp. AX1]